MRWCRPLTGIELAPRIVTAEQYEAEQQHKHLVPLTDRQVGMLEGGITVTTGTKRRRAWDVPGLGIAVWLQRTMGLRILANISQVLGHDSVQTTLKFYITPAPTPRSASAR